MMRLEKILLATDLSERSGRALRYAASLAVENRATLTVFHVANEFEAWELYSDEFSFMTRAERAWPTDRVIQKASLELDNFIKSNLEMIEKLPDVSKRVALGPIPEEIVIAAEDSDADLVILSPRPYRVRPRILTASITDQVCRISPCPVLALTDTVPPHLCQGKLERRIFGWSKQSIPAT